MYNKIQINENKNEIATNTLDLIPPIFRNLWKNQKKKKKKNEKRTNERGTKRKFFYPSIRFHGALREHNKRQLQWRTSPLERDWPRKRRKVAEDPIMPETRAAFSPTSPE